MTPRLARLEQNVDANMTPLRCPRAVPLAAVILIGLGLSAPTAACNLDGIAGPGHGGFGAWGRLSANRHTTQPPPSAGNFDSGDSAVGGNSDAEESDAEGSEQVYNVLPGPAVEVRESGGSVSVEEIRDEELIDLRIMR